MRRIPKPAYLLVSLALAGTAAAAGNNPPTRTSTAKAPATGDTTRRSAQRGIHYLANATAQWSQANKCYGCHVQAVTLEALSVGKHNQYDVPADKFGIIKNSILNDDGGARGPNGLYHGSFPKTARTFGSLALARHDQLVDDSLRDDLVRAARQLLAMQEQNGSVPGDHVSPPVTVGVMQSTYQAMQTWRQAYARTADTVWLTPIQKAERYVQTTSASWDGLKGSVAHQDINYALLGLMSANVSPSEETPARLIKHLRTAQNKDGGWSLNGGNSDAYATGQTVYALRVAGLGEQDRNVAQGINWLVSHQQQDGSWGASGSGKAEAMWAVLGMVSVDVMSLEVSGLQDGTRIQGNPTIKATAKDNQGGGAKAVSILVNDVKVADAAGNTITHTLDTSKLPKGAHVVDILGTNDKGQQSRRRYTVYVGDIFVTQVGSRFANGSTLVTYRSLTDAAEKGTVRTRIFALNGANGGAKGNTVFETTQAAQSGAMELTWNGAGKDGKALPKGRFLAELTYVDASGKERQTETTAFFQDTEEAQKENFAEVRGRLNLGGGRGAANTKVDLVDDDGRVVQSTVSTEAGEYRFKNVDQGKYKVRVQKDGYAPQAAPVEAKKAQEAAASMDLK